MTMNGAVWDFLQHPISLELSPTCTLKWPSSLFLFWKFVFKASKVQADRDNNNNNNNKITNLLYIVQFDTNGILTALYIVIKYIQTQYMHIWTYMKQLSSYTFTCLHIYTYTDTIIMTLKCAIRDFLQSPHCPLNCLPTCTLKWPGCSQVHIMSNTLGAYHVQYIVCHMVERDSSGTMFNDLKSHLFQLILLVETINWWGRVETGAWGKKTPMTSLRKYFHTKAQNFKSHPRLEPAR